MAAMTFADASYPSICLPFVHKSINWKQIKSVIQDQGLGVVDRVDVASKKSGNKAFNIVFVHFKQWADTPEITQLRTDLHSNKDPKHYERIVFDEEGHYWKFTKSHVDRPVRESRKVSPKKDSVESIDALLRKEFATLAAVQKRIADLQSKRSSLLLDVAVAAIATTTFPPTKQQKNKNKVKKTKTIKKPCVLKIRAPTTPPMSPPAGGTPTFTPPFMPAPESPISWADEVESEIAE